VRECSRHVQRLQKTLEDANIKLDSVISDIVGLSCWWARGRRSWVDLSRPIAGTRMVGIGASRSLRSVAAKVA